MKIELKAGSRRGGTAQYLTADYTEQPVYLESLLPRSDFETVFTEKRIDP